MRMAGTSRGAVRLGARNWRMGRLAPLTSLVVVALAAGLAGVAAPRAAAATPGLSPLCAGKPAFGPFTTGNRDGRPVVLGTGGSAHPSQQVVFDSYGTSVPGLSANPSSGLGKWSTWAGTVNNKDIPKIEATANDWCGNTVRLQVSQDDLLGPAGTGYFPAYMRAIKTEVQAALNSHLVVVINDNTESDQQKAAELMATPATVRFWSYLTKAYGGNAQVIFDLFNEPREHPFGIPLLDWCVWRDGGLPPVEQTQYLGMEQLARDVRDQGARNLFWIEGPNYSDSFAGMLRACGPLTRVGPVAYALHHPLGVPTTTSWYFDFGYLINRDIAPVVDGEWTNIQPAHKTCPAGQRCSGPSQTGSCWALPNVRIPQFLAYLRAKNIGLNVYQLAADYLINTDYSVTTGPDVFRQPTSITPGTWHCNPYQVTNQDQGPGQLVMKAFRSYAN